MFREITAGVCLVAALGCGREPTPSANDAPVRTLRRGDAATRLGARDLTARAGARLVGFAALDGDDAPGDDARDSEAGARVRVTLVRATRTRGELDAARFTEGGLAEESVAIEGTRRDGSRLVSFRRDRSDYELSGLRDDGEVVWLRALDAEAEDGAAPLALIGLSRGVLDDTRALRVAIDAALPKAGFARVVARVLDARGAPRARVRAYPLPGASGPRVDDERGELRAGDVTGSRGVIVYDDVDPSRQALTITLATAHGRTSWVARVLPDVTTTLLIEIED